MKNENIVQIVIGFNMITEEIQYINSDFEKQAEAYKDPIGYTAQLLQMAYDKWLAEKIGLFCPECDERMHQDWVFCPNCGWGNKE